MITDFTLRVAALATLAAAGCISIPTKNFQAASAGAIGCPPDEIEISDQRYGATDLPTWRATCRGRAFICSNAGKDPQCAEELRPAGAPPAK